MSKWTAVNPSHKERHFIVAEIIEDEYEQITGCVLEAVINKNTYSMDWQDLRDKENWLMGWK